MFTAETKAIDLALDFINSCFLSNKFLIFSDSLSVLKALNHTSSRNSQIQKLLEKHHQITKSKEILFCWLPSHIDITGNEAADRKAKESLKLNMSTFEITFNNFKPFINTWGWSGGAMALDKLPEPGRPTIWITVGQGPTALVVGAGGGCLDIFTLIYPFLSSFSLSLGDGPI